MHVSCKLDFRNVRERTLLRQEREREREMAASKQTFAVVPMSTLDRVRRNINVNPENVDVSESQIERQYLRTLSKQRSNKWPNTLDVRSIDQYTCEGMRM